MLCLAATLHTIAPLTLILWGSLPWNALLDKGNGRREAPKSLTYLSSETGENALRVDPCPARYLTAKTAKGVVRENYPTRFGVTHEYYLP
jgi:hypothetical protein